MRDFVGRRGRWIEVYFPLKDTGSGTSSISLRMAYKNATQNTVKWGFKEYKEDIGFLLPIEFLQQEKDYE